MVNKLNELINCKNGNKDGKLVVLELNTMIRNAPNFLHIKHYNQQCHDNLHLNCITELPTLPNSLLSVLMKTSNKFTDALKISMKSHKKIRATRADSKLSYKRPSKLFTLEKTTLIQSIVSVQILATTKALTEIVT